jgi:hypothetical protein
MALGHANNLSRAHEPFNDQFKMIKGKAKLKMPQKCQQAQHNTVTEKHDLTILWIV